MFIFFFVFLHLNFHLSLFLICQILSKNYPMFYFCSQYLFSKSHILAPDHKNFQT